ncbi:MAG: hypothetical protein FWF59_07590 [Turicibacter sp.]|nr:hypothetical protein [Turicibacter sp.]
MIPDILADYQQIYTDYPATAPLTRAQRKERHQRLMAWEKGEYDPLPTFFETVAFMQAHPDFKFEKPFAMKVLCPLVLERLTYGDIQPLKHLFALNAKDRRIGNAATNYVDMLAEWTGWQKTRRQLIDVVLEQEPDFQAALMELHHLMGNHLGFTIHETPWAVLADKEAMPGLYQELAEFEVVSEKLGYDDEAFIKEVRTLYQAWEDFLDHADEYDDYTGFEEYLIKHDIEYR